MRICFLALLVAGCGPQLSVSKLITKDDQIAGGLQIAAGQVWYITRTDGLNAGRIRAALVSGSDPHTVATTFVPPKALAVDGQWIYYPDVSVPGLARLDAAGKLEPIMLDAEPIFLDGTETGVTPWPLHGQALYCFGGIPGVAGAALYRVPTDGMPATPLPGQVDGAGSQQHGPVVDGGYLYWANDNGPDQPGAIVRAAVDGSSAETLTVENGTVAIAASGGYVWWATASQLTMLWPDGRLAHYALDRAVNSMVADDGVLYLAVGSVDGAIERLEPGGQPEVLTMQTNPSSIAAAYGIVAWVQGGLSIRYLSTKP